MEKLLRLLVIIKSLVSLGNPECKKYENIEIVLKENDDTEVEKLPLDYMMYVYAKELGREIPDVSKLSNKERINLKEELSYTYNVKNGISEI